MPIISPFPSGRKRTITAFASQDTVELLAIRSPTLPCRQAITTRKCPSQPRTPITTNIQRIAPTCTTQDGGSTPVWAAVLHARTRLTFNGIVLATTSVHLEQRE